MDGYPFFWYNIPMSEEEKVKFHERIPKYLGIGLLLVFLLSLNLGPTFFPEFFQQFTGEKIFGGFESREHSVYGLVGGLACFFLAPFILGILLVISARSVPGESWSYLTFFGTFMLGILGFIFVIKYIYHCGKYVQIYYGNDFIQEHFVIVIWGYFLFLGILKTVVLLVKD